ncbi:MAG: SGNH/GDSL hydrolase family protein [Limisphaerales bacterium]
MSKEPNPKARRRITGRRLAIFSLIVIVVFFVALELLARVVFFQMERGGLALPLAVRTAQLKVANRVQGPLQAGIKKKGKDIFQGFYGPDGEGIRAHLTGEYERWFLRLQKACQQADSKLVVLYIPVPRWPERGSPLSVSEKFCRGYFRDLSAKHRVEFWDAAELIHTNDATVISLYPEDPHLNTTGNHLVAAYLRTRLAEVASIRSKTKYSPQPGALYGDFLPNQNRIEEGAIPIRRITNSHGCRGLRDLDAEKKRQRILFLGDSFTYGTGVESFESFPAILERQVKDVEFLNAGKYGYTIVDEATLFEERARHCAPDITVLQVLDNDLIGLLSYKLNSFSRERTKQPFQPTEEELTFLKKFLNEEEIAYIKRGGAS